MKTRTSNLVDEKLVSTVLRMRRDLDDLKNRQRTSMASGVLGYLNQNAGDWDLIGTVGSDSDVTTRDTVITIDFTGDGSQDVAFANVGYAVYVNGTDAAHRLTLVNMWESGDANDAIPWTDGTRSAYGSPDGPTISHHFYESQFYLTTFKQITYYVKALVPASQRGSVSVYI